MDNLKFVQTDDLITELLTRFDHCIIAGIRDKTDDNKNVNWRFKGSFESIALLTDFLKQENFERWIKKLKPIKEGDF